MVVIDVLISIAGTATTITESHTVENWTASFYPYQNHVIICHLARRIVVLNPRDSDVEL